MEPVANSSLFEQCFCILHAVLQPVAATQGHTQTIDLDQLITLVRLNIYIFI